MGLKEQIDADRSAVFLNPADFGETHEINGAEVVCVVDADNVHMRSGGQRASTVRRNEGVREGSFVLYVHADDFGRKPESHQALTLDGKKTYIASVQDEGGVLVIECSSNAHGIKRSFPSGGA